MTIDFVFDAKKTVEAASILLEMHGGTMKYLGLLKLLYMADRAGFTELGMSITGDKYVCMEYGPVLSSVYDLIKGNKVSTENANDIWKQHISTRDADYNVKLLKKTEVEELRKAELEIIERIYQQCGNYDRFELAELTHTFREWKDPLKENRKCLPLYLETILREIDKSSEEISYIKEKLEEKVKLNYLLNAC